MISERTSKNNSLDVFHKLSFECVLGTESETNKNENKIKPNGEHLNCFGLSRQLHSHLTLVTSDSAIRFGAYLLLIILSAMSHLSMI